MDEVRLLVLADPAVPQLGRLERLRGVRVTAGGTRDEVAAAAVEADVILVWFGAAGLLREIWPRATRAVWIHSMAAGLDHLLFPELVESPAALTNGRGVFSQSLAEFAIGAVLFFAKDFRRMLRSQARGAWEPFDVEVVGGRTLGIVGYGDIGRAVARPARSLGMRGLAPPRDPAPTVGDTPPDPAVAPQA